MPTGASLYDSISCATSFSVKYLKKVLTSAFSNFNFKQTEVFDLDSLVEAKKSIQSFSSTNYSRTAKFLLDLS